MSLMFEPIRKYATFRGRARRKEFWLYQLLIIILVSILMTWLVSALGPGLETATDAEIAERIAATPSASFAAILLALASLFFFLPSLAVSVRRLHDSDKSGWWLLLNFVPFGALVLFIFYLLDGTRGPNRHGEDPKGRSL